MGPTRPKYPTLNPYTYPSLGKYVNLEPVMNYLSLNLLTLSPIHTYSDVVPVRVNPPMNLFTHSSVPSENRENSS